MKSLQKTRLLSHASAATLITALLATPANAALTQSATGVSYGSGPTVYIGDGADGWVQLDNGSDLDTHYTYIGYEAGKTGTLTVTGNGTNWDAEDSSGTDVHVGYRGHGILNVEDNADVYVRDSLRSGRYSGASGEINVNTGGFLESKDHIYYAESGNTEVTTTVTGTNSRILRTKKNIRRRCRTGNTKCSRWC